MNLNEIFNKVLVLSGQFLIPDSVIELRVDKFKFLVEQVLGIINNYNPVDKYLYKDLSAGRQYTFTALNTPDGIPDNIVDVTPVRISGVAPYFLAEYALGGSELDVKKSFPWVYRNPILTLPINAEVQIHAIYHHKITVDNVAGGEPAYKVSTLNANDDDFFELLTGKFLQALGRSRRAFTLNDLPITVDGAELVSEGKQMCDEALNDLIENKSKWYLSWR